MNDAWLIPGLVLAVLASPLIYAWLVARAARKGADNARILAAWLAGTHVILTVAVIVLGAEALPKTHDGSFHPVGVPGDPGLSAKLPTGTTTWTLIPLTAPNLTSLGGTAVQLFFGLDGLNLPLILLTSVMTFLAILVAWPTLETRAGGFLAWLFLLEAACLGAFLSFDLLLFYVFFELTLIPAFFLIGSYGHGGGRRDAARKFFLYTLFGSLFTLVGMIGIAVTNPEPLNPVDLSPRVDVKKTMPISGAITFSIPKLMHNVTVWDDAYEAAVQREKSDTAREAQKDRRYLAAWLFVALLAGFAVKVPIVPFHTWLPAAYAEAPLAITMLLSAILAKLGTFGILRIVLPLCPEPCVQYGLNWVGALGAFGILYAGFCAYGQKDLRLLAAYSSVSHLGFVVLALFALTVESVVGATLHMVNHALTAGAMFALLAFLSDRYRTLDMNQYSGLWSRTPRFVFFLMVIALASVGLPGLANFVSEMLMLAGLFDPRNLATAGFGLAAAAAAGIFLGAWYTFTMIRKVAFGPPKDTATSDINAREQTVYTAFAAGCLALGLFPQPLIELVEPDVKRVVTAAESARVRLKAEQKSPASYKSETHHP